MTEEISRQVAIIRESPQRIISIAQPCEEAQIEAVTRHPELFGDITTPTPLVCKIAIERFLNITINGDITDDIIEKTRYLFFLLSDIDMLYGNSDLPDPDLLCDEYQEYDGKQFFLNNIAPTDTYQHTRQIIINEYLKAINHDTNKSMN